MNYISWYLNLSEKGILVCSSAVAENRRVVYILNKCEILYATVKVVEWLTRSPAIARFSKVSGCLLGAQVRILSLTFLFAFCFTLLMNVYAGLYITMFYILL